MTYQTRRRSRLVAVLLCVLMGLPPGSARQVLANGAFNNPLTRDSAMEAFRNPAITSGQYNRFLMTQHTGELLGGGGEDLRFPAMRGNRWDDEPNAIWATNKGRIEWTEEDIQLPGISRDEVFSRIYRGSVQSYDGPLGNRWDFSWNKRVTKISSNLIFYDMGRQVTYTPSGGGAYTSPAGRYDTVSESGDHIYRTDKYGLTEDYYAQSGMKHLIDITDLHGNVSSFDWWAEGGESGINVISDAGFIAQVAFDGQGYIQYIYDWALPENYNIWAYKYDANHNLTKVTTPAFNSSGDSGHSYTSGRSTIYKYDSDNRLTGIAQPNDAGSGTESWKWEYDASGQTGKVTRQYTNGNPLTIAYDETNKRVTVVDRVGQDNSDLRTIYDYDASLNITKRKVYTASSTSYDTTWAYNSDNEVTGVTLPRGNRIRYTYDSLGNINAVSHMKDSSDTTPIVWEYGYGDYSRLEYLTDPNGNEWAYTYNDTGDLITKTAPAVTVPSGIAATNKNSSVNSTYDGTIVETWAYDEWGNVTSHALPDGTVDSGAYASGATDGKPLNLTRLITDPGSGHLNITRSYGYDAMAMLTQYTDAVINSTNYTFNGMRELIKTTEPGSVERNYYHDLNGNLTKTKESNDALGGDSSCGGSNDWFESEMSFDRLNNLTQLVMDLDKCAKLTTTREYDKNDRLTKLNEPGSVSTVWSYDNRDLRTGITRKGATSGDDQVTALAYDSNGLLTAMTDPRAQTTVLSYDDYDRLTRLIKPAGNYWSRNFDKSGNVTVVAYKNGGNSTLASTTYRYDQANRLYQTERLAQKADLSTSIGDGSQARTLWRDEMGRLIEVSGEGCGSSLGTLVYDKAGRLLTVADVMGSDANQIIMAYDKEGQVTSRTLRQNSQDTNLESDKDVVTLFEYDARHRPVTRRERLDATPTYGVIAFAYGKRDQVTQVTDAEGRIRLFEHNERLWPTKTTEVVGDVTSVNDVTVCNTYDITNRKITYTASNATTGDQESVYTYDQFRRLATKDWPVRNDKSIYTYDKASNRISYTDPNGTVSVRAYDNNNNVVSDTLTGIGLGATSVLYLYDGLDRLTSAETDENGSYESLVTRSFNTLDRIQSETQVINGYNSGAGRTVTSGWDIDGQRTAVTYPVAGTVVTHERDALDRVDKISRGSTQVVDYTFSGDRVIKKEVPGSHALFTYDGFGRLTQIHHKDTSSGNTLAKLVYAYDKRHQLTSQDKYIYDDVQNTRITTDTVDLGDQYAYDGARRLVTVLRGVPSAYIGDSMASNISNNRYNELVQYKYDQVGNRTTRDASTDTLYTYNKANEMLTEGGITRQYDENGNVTSNGSNLAIGYEHNDQYAKYYSGVVGTPTYKYHYDAFGRYIARTKTGSGGTGDVRMYYDGLHEVERVGWASPSETLISSNVYGERIDELLEYTDVTANPDNVYYACLDRLGSVMLMVDGNGTIKESYRYDEFGDTTVVDGSFVKQTTQGSNIGNFKRFTGRERLLGTALGLMYDLRARAYTPNTGRFAQRDPLGFVDGSNRYSYVAENPLRWTDPMGLGAGDPYNSIDEAARAAMTEAYPGMAAENASETGGVIYQIDKDHYSYTKTTNNSAHYVCTLEGTHGMKVVADWHTHPHSKNHFHIKDIRDAESIGPYGGIDGYVVKEDGTMEHYHHVEGTTSAYGSVTDFGSIQDPKPHDDVVIIKGGPDMNAPGAGAPVTPPGPQPSDYGD